MNEAPAALSQNFIKFIGTAGARFVTISQMRASGGIWISYEGTNILIDPGPGSLVKCLESKPKLDPSLLDAIIVTHKHIDHCNDINIMVEAMTQGGSKKRGVVFVPEDMLGTDSVFVPYARNLPENIVLLKAKENYSIGKVKFSTPFKHLHAVETYGLKFVLNDKNISFIVDTNYSVDLIKYYQADLLIINTVFIEPIAHIDHLSIKEAGTIISAIRPQKAVLTHFGRDVIKEGPERFAKQLTETCGVEVVAATDGMTLPL